MAERPHIHGYGPVLVLILAVISFQLAAPDAEWARYVSVVLQAVTILAVGHAAGAGGPLQRILVRMAAIVLVVSTVLFATGEQISLPRLPKEDVATEIVAHVARICAARPDG